MDLKQLILDNFYAETDKTTWLLEKDNTYRTTYFNLLAEIEQMCIDDKDLDEVFDYFISQTTSLIDLFEKRLKNPSYWEAPKIYAANELVHDNGKLTMESVELLSTTIANKTSEKSLVSDTGKAVYFGEDWHRMLNDCDFKDVAVSKITDFISKFIAPDGWKKYFVNNIGKNNKQLIQEYHVMDSYNLKHHTSYAALHLGGNTTRCVLLEVKTGTKDGKGEPKCITFLEIGAHTIIDRFDTSNYKPKVKKVITEATPEDLAILFDIE